MPQKIGYVFATIGTLTEIHTTQRNTLGVRSFDDAGNEYVYMQGIASTVVGSVVTHGLSATSVWLTALSVAGARGPVAIAMAAVLASQFGWYQIYGLASASFTGAATAGALIFSAGTGQCSTTVVAGDRIDNAKVAATVAAAGLGSVFLDYPHMNNGG